MRILKRLFKWALIIAAVAGVIRWLKSKREAEGDEQDPGSIEPWPPLDAEVPAGDASEEPSDT